MPRSFLMRTLMMTCCAAACAVPTSCQAPGPKLPPRETRFYAGTSDVSLPTGEVVGHSEMIVERTTNPQSNMIIERVVTPANPASPTQEFIVEMTISGNSLVMKEKNGAFDGTGSLVGQPWHWTAWHTESKLQNGASVISDDHLDGKSLEAKKTVKDPAGTIVVTIDEHYSEISQTEFERRRAEMLAQKPSAPTEPPASAK